VRPQEISTAFETHLRAREHPERSPALAVSKPTKFRDRNTSHQRSAGPEQDDCARIQNVGARPRLILGENNGEARGPLASHVEELRTHMGDNFGSERSDSSDRERSFLYPDSCFSIT